MDKNFFKTFVKNVDSQIFEIASNLICSICQELFNKPVTTPCGHSFCNGCIKRVLSSKDNNGCPLCKNPVKRYGLEEDAVKSTLSKLCKELPDAFGKDVEDLSKNYKKLDLGEDIIKTTKLFHLYNQEYAKECSTSNKKVPNKRKTKKTNESKFIEVDSESFIPVLKRTKNVLEYASAKKKRMGDLISVSQTEPASNSSLCDSSDLDKKLKNIEKIPPEKKVNEWFNAVGDNIYINSPSSYFLEEDTKITSENETKEENLPTMIRRNYIKPKPLSKNQDDTIGVDPYDFVPSQNSNYNNNNNILNKNKKTSAGTNISDFKALESFSKENIKRTTILLDDSTEKVETRAEYDTNVVPIQKLVTASQKFDQLLLEGKKDENKPHVLYSASQSSSAQFLDVSFHSKIEENFKIKKTPKAQKKSRDPENILFKNVEVHKSEKEERRIKGKRQRSVGSPKSGKKKKLFEEIMSMKSDEACQLEESIEKYLIKRSKKAESRSTKLKDLLTELLNDDIIYATRPANAPVRLPDLVMGVVDAKMPILQKGDTDTQNTDLIGFCTQEETPYEKNFKKMVENMERELNSSEYSIETAKETENNFDVPKAKSLENNIKVNSNVFENETNLYELTEEKSEISKLQLVEFLHLGRLTPIRKRAKSTVVKLVFPIGLTSLARRRAFENRCFPPISASKTKPCKVSMGLQISNETVSCLVQTSQVPQSSFNMQTSQEEKPSVEIQTTQKLTKTEEIQTSQKLVCREIQTSQTFCESAQVQTSHPPFSFDSNSKVSETPMRKPSHKHRKIIQNKSFKETSSDSPPKIFPPKEKSLPEKDLLMDFEIEKEFEETWKNTEKREHLVEMKNKKNKRVIGARRKSVDLDSDDSDVQPPRRKGSFRIFSQDSTGTLEKNETRQLIPSNVTKTNEDEEVEVIDLDTPESQNSEEQVLRVLKNINLDLPKGKNGNTKGEKSEESDSDFFVEQTPPRPTSRSIDDIKNLSRSRSGLNFAQKHSEINEFKNERKENSENSDLICDSIPKGFSESFQLLSTPQRVPLPPEKNPKDEAQKKTFKIETTVPFDLPDENDQNQLNAFEGKVKTAQIKAVVDVWKQNEPTIKSSTKKLCVVASSVKNPDLVKKFASKFNIEYLNKPTKDMTHLIVGLHENEDKEVLPFCTPKLLFAMANKKWVVNELWAESCLKMNTILPEDAFETLDPVGGCGCRKARLSNDKLLKQCEIYLLGDFQMISKEEFADLVTDCGGNLVPAPEKFSFLPSKLRMIIADRDCLKLNEKQLQDLYQKHSTVILSRDVIIMSIQSYKLVNFYPYILHLASEENLVKLGYPLHLVRNEEEEEEEEEEDSNGAVFR